MRSHTTIISDEEAYFIVLCELIGLKKPIKECGYFELMNQLFDTEFYWSVPNDDNRSLDGLMLREKYGYSIFKDRPCTVLEMLIALAQRCDSDMMYNPTDGDRSGDWFWMMLANLGLNKFRDISFKEAWYPNDVTYVTDRLMDREYYTNGTGGLFPLKHAKEDQTEIEIWYQMCAYLLENYDLG